MDTEIFLVRHGQSAGNLERRFLGHTDRDLSELGYKQAELLRSAFSKIELDAVYSSDLQRAYHTAYPTAQDKRLDVIKLSDLREVYAGKWENRLFAELIEEFPISYGDTWLNNLGRAHPDGGESVEELQARVVRAIEKIADENRGKKVMIATHATPIRTFAAHVLGLSLDCLDRCPWVPNASITKIGFDGNGFSLLSYGEYEHLGEFVSRLPKTV